MTSRSMGPDNSSPKSPSTGIASVLQFGHSVLGRPNQSFTTPTKQVSDALANVGKAQVQPPLPFQWVQWIGSLLGMLLHLTPRKLEVHADRHVDNLIAVFLAGHMMALRALLAPVLEPPKGARSLAGALG